MDKILVKNFSNGQVAYTLPERRIRRYWAKEGQQIPIPVDELTEALYEPGIENLFTDGFLGIEKKADRIRVGLDIEEIDREIKPFTSSDAERILTISMSKEQLQNELKSLTSAGRDMLITVACKKENVDLNKLAIIKETIGVDILSMINNSKEQ